MLPNIGAPELIVILIIALIVLGPGKLPDVAASLGKSVREFRKAATDVSEAARIDQISRFRSSVRWPTRGIEAGCVGVPGSADAAALIGGDGQ